MPVKRLFSLFLALMLMLPLNFIGFINPHKDESKDLSLKLRAQVCLKYLRISEALNISSANIELLPRDLNIEKMSHDAKFDLYIFTKLTGQDDKANELLTSYIEDNDENSQNLLSKDKYATFCQQLDDSTRKYMASKALGLDPKEILSPKELSQFNTLVRVEALFAITIILIFILSILYAMVGIYRALVDLYKYLTVQDIYLDVDEFTPEEISIIDDLESNIGESKDFKEEVVVSKEEQSNIWDPIKTVWAFVSLSWLSIIMAAVIGGIMLYFSLGNEIFQTFFVQILIYAVNIFLLFRYLPKLMNLPDNTPKVHLLKYLGLGDNWAKYIPQAFMGYGALLMSAFFSSWLFQYLTNHEPVSSNKLLVYITSGTFTQSILIVFLALVAPFYEEIIFRGLLFGGTRSTFSPILAASFSSVYFALVHGDIQVTISLLGMGLVLCWLYQRTNSLWPSILCHFMWNGSVIFYMFYLLKF
ncbi:CPBP family intramembrane metalloprotease [bacterium]|nr:CPBP family intramembrane metalloprotease [bacterium]